MKDKFKFTRQLESMDCGPACLKMICSFYGKSISLDYSRDICDNSKQGVNLSSIKTGAKALGFNSVATEVTLEQLINNTPQPSILFWRQNHFVILKEVKKEIKFSIFGVKIPQEKFIIADPAHGVISLNKDTIIRNWINGSTTGKGIVLLLEPDETFVRGSVKEDECKKKNKIFPFLYKYISKYNSNVFALVMCMVIGATLNLAFPILTQKVVDTGIELKDFNFISLVLIAQILIFVSGTFIEILKSWILLFINTRVSITITSDFILKIMRLPLKYFDSKLTTDIIQRLNDNNRIQHFLTTSVLETLFATGNFIVFSVLLISYSVPIFFLFFSGSLISVIWIFLFMNKRAELDYSKFDISSENNNNILELIAGMPEIKLNNAENALRWDWEKIQIKLFDLNSQSLKLEQYQQIGNTFLNQLKNIIITFIAAKEVIDGNISLGSMLSISYIVGQMNSPITQLISFFSSAQDTKISLDRLNEVNNRSNEDEIAGSSTTDIHKVNNEDCSIFIDKISFRYTGVSTSVLNDLSLEIPVGKITAIVGTSGSGKTTLMKLLLKFYLPINGNIFYGNHNLKMVPADDWRRNCGAVMQDGFIFSGTIEKNIGLGDVNIDKERLFNAAKMANIDSYINSLPLKYKTIIGNAGNNLSLGQKQRILIARAVYKNPKILFFDEATSSLDANNELVIMNNLNEYFKGKTVIIIAHRLSTVKNADQIVVLDNGNIVEVGNHQSLTEKRGEYYNLVKNQLELGS